MSNRVVIPTGIIQDWPSPKTGKIYRSSVFQTLMDLDLEGDPVPGVLGDFPETLSRDELQAIRHAIEMSPETANLVGFQVEGLELQAIVEVESEEAFTTLSSAPWKIRMIIDYGGQEPSGFEITYIKGVVAFWLELSNEEN